MERMKRRGTRATEIQLENDRNEIKGDKGLDIKSKWFLDLVDRIEN